MIDLKRLDELNFFDPEIAACPFEFYELAQAHSPVYKLPTSPIPGRDLFVICNYELVTKAILDTERFSNKFGSLMGRSKTVDPDVKEIRGRAYESVDTMLTQDLPAHRSYKTLAKKAFNAGRISRMTDYIRGICDELIDAIEDKSECNFLEDFAVHLPIYVIADQLGVPRTDLPKFRQWTDHIIAGLSQLGDKQDALNAANSVLEFQNYFVDVIEQRRLTPKDDIISDLVNLDLNGERKLDIPELLSIIQQILVAGNETTRNALTGGMLYIIENNLEQQLAKDPSLIPNAVDEILRLEAGTKNMWRIVKADTEFGNVAMKAGDALLLSFDAANRDPAQFPAPHEFDLQRENTSSHLSFGKGIHFCVGAPLARQEMRIAYEALFSRLKNFRLADNMGKPEYLPSVLHRGLLGLSVEFEKK